MHALRSKKLIRAATRRLLLAAETTRTASAAAVPRRAATTATTVLKTRKNQPLTCTFATADASSPSFSPSSHDNFQPGQKVQVEVLSFGPLGASVDVIGLGHNPDDVLPEGEEPLGKGLILQKEIQYFRQGRDNVDVVRGEVLPAYVERIRENGRIDIALRAFGGKAKAQDTSQAILDALEVASNGELNVGDKSTPQEIAALFPGTSKGAFKKAVSLLYRQGKVQPGPSSIRLMSKEEG